MTGEIYLITNKINNKKYVGKTTKGFKYRYIDHISKAYSIDYSTYEYKYNTKFYRAIRKYGKDNFIIELLGVFDIELLNCKEQEYIVKYDSYHNGYNSTLGGDGGSCLELSEDDIKFIMEEYSRGKSANSIATELGVSAKTIVRLLRANGIDIRRDSNSPLQIIMYDKYFNPIRVFDSKKDIVTWLENNTSYAINLHSIYGLITKACQNGNVAYGHRWQLSLDLCFGDKVFRTRFDKEAYIQGKKAYQSDGKQYYITDGALDGIKIPKKEVDAVDKKHCTYCNKIIEYNRRVCDSCKISRRLNYDRNIRNRKNYKLDSSNLRCIICGNTITAFSTSGMCNKCANKELNANNKPDKPSKEYLTTLVNQGMQTKQIAELYNRSASTVSTWIKKYGIK